MSDQYQRAGLQTQANSSVLGRVCVFRITQDDLFKPGDISMVTEAERV